LRQDLRLADNPRCKRRPAWWADYAGICLGAGGRGDWPRQRLALVVASVLAQLAESFRAAGTELLIRQGSSLAELLSVAKATAQTPSSGTGAMNRDHRRDRKIERPCTTRDCRPKLQRRAAHEPWTIQIRLAGRFRSSRRSGRLPWLGEPSEPLPASRRLAARLDRPHRCRWTRSDWSPNLIGPQACALPGTRQRRRRSRATALFA